MFEVEALHTQVGNFHLQGVQFTLGEGECHAVLGPSGSGKTTLLKAILGALPLTSGRIHLGGEDITQWPMERRRLGYVPQQLGLFPHLLVSDNIRYSARARKIAPGDFEPLLEKLIEITGIGYLLQRRIGTLSGGERQRVALVRALAANPRMVLLDEPFTALNEALRRELWWLVKDLQRERGLSALLITHDLTEAYFLAEKITILIDGRQEQSGHKTVIYRHPANLAVLRFLGLKNLFPATVIETTQQEIVADCPVLGHRFRLQGQAPVGTAIRIGIRPEDILLRDRNHPPNPDECRLTGAIRLMDMGASIGIHFHAPQLPTHIEIITPRRIAENVQLESHQNDTSIALPTPALFWVQEE